LPQSWQGDARFSTVEDIAEISTGRESLAEMFDDFIEDGRLVGPLVHISDLTVADVELLLAVEDRCRALERPERADGSDPCSFVAELDAETILALPEDIIAVLPDNYLDQLSLIERNEIAGVRVAEAISGQTATSGDVELPEAWQVEAPQILTFNFSDFALGTVSVNSEEMSADELRAFVENELMPRLREADLVASVNAVGGEDIPVEIQNEARAVYDLAPLEGSSAIETPDDAPQAAPSTSTQTGGDEQELPEGPPLDAAWGALTAFTGLDAFDTADDIFKVVGTDIQGVQIESAAGFINALNEQETARFLLDSLTPEILDYLAEHEPGFYDNVESAVLTAILSPTLGQAWTQLSRQPVMGDTQLTNVAELEQAGAVDTIATILEVAAANGTPTYAIQLMDSLTPDAIEALTANNPDFLSGAARVRVVFARACGPHAPTFASIEDRMHCRGCCETYIYI
jgi:hypothetical protein